MLGRGINVSVHIRLMYCLIISILFGVLEDFAAWEAQRVLLSIPVAVYVDILLGEGRTREDLPAWYWGLGCVSSRCLLPGQHGFSENHQC